MPEHIGHLLLGVFAPAARDQSAACMMCFSRAPRGSTAASSSSRSHLLIQVRLDSIRLGPQNVGEQQLVAVPVHIERFVNSNLSRSLRGLAQKHQNFVFDAA